MRWAQWEGWRGTLLLLSPFFLSLEESDGAPVLTLGWRGVENRAINKKVNIQTNSEFISASVEAPRGRREAGVQRLVGLG